MLVPACCASAGSIKLFTSAYHLGKMVQSTNKSTEGRKKQLVFYSPGGKVFYVNLSEPNEPSTGKHETQLETTVFPGALERLEMERLH